MNLGHLEVLIIFLMFSGFVKICTTLSIFKFGLGLDGVAFGLVVLILSLATTLFVSESSGVFELKQLLSNQEFKIENAKGFLERNTDPKVTDKLTEIETKLGKASESKLLVAFLITELQKAFELGLIIIIPFLIIDLLVSNILAILSVTQISAIVIALPLKLLLFVSVGGFDLIINKILKTYVG